MTVRATRLALIGALLIAGVSAASSQSLSSVAEPDTQVVFSGEIPQLLPIDEEDLLVLEVRIGNTSSGHGLIAYPHGEKALLPLGEICSILELAVLVDPHAGRADGWIIDESRTFVLDIPNRTVTIDGNLSPLPDRCLALDETDIYVEQSRLAQWLPIDLDLNLPRMHVKITPRELLPFQSRLKRDEQRSIWLATRGRSELQYTRHVAPYRMWSWPMIDATMGLTSNRNGSSQRLSLHSNTDLGGLSSNIFLSHSRDAERSFTSTRIKAGRWNPQGGLLGPASATRYEFGDLHIARIPLISSRVQGTGAMISNQSLHRSREFDTTDIEGDAPAGWEAELYINGALYDFLTVGDDGRYVFERVPLIVGPNVFRTVLYGPRGETREVVEHANISPQMSDVGQLKYTVSVVREGDALLHSGLPELADDSKPWNRQMELAYALSSRYALVGNVSQLNIAGTPESFSSLANHASLGKFYLEGILARAGNGGDAWSLGLQTRAGRHNIVARRTRNNDYRAESLDGNKYVHAQTTVRTSGNLLETRRRNLFYSFSAYDRVFRDSDLLDEREYQMRLSTGFRKLMLSHYLDLRDRDYVDGSVREWRGTQLMRTWLGPVSVRGDLNYDLSPGRLRSATATFNYTPAQTFRATARAGHYFRDAAGLDNISLEFTRLFDHFTLGCNMSYYESLGASFGLTIGTFLARDVRAGQWASAHRPMSNRAIASVRTYVDLNGNRVFDGDDEPLAGVGFLNLTPWKKIRTNAEGYAFLPGLLVHRPQVIELNLPTISDPFLKPIEKGATVVGHPGGIVDVEFPFTYAGEIEGMLVDGGHPDRPVRHVGLELLNAAGEQVATTVGEFDGFYYLPDILPGEYEIRVIPRTVNQRIFEVPAPHAISIPSSGGFLTGPDIVFERHYMESESLVREAGAGLGPGIRVADGTDGKTGAGSAVVERSPVAEPTRSGAGPGTTAAAAVKATPPTVVLNPLRIRVSPSGDAARKGRLDLDHACTRK